MLATNEKRSFSKVLWALLVAGTLGLSACGSGGGSDSNSVNSASSTVSAAISTSSSATANSANATILPTQNWTLTNEFGDVAYVIIVPFTTTGTFTESCNSPGWWLRDANNNRVVRIPLNGTITHAAQNDSWDFTISELSGGVRLTGLGTGSTTNGTYPAARNVRGTVAETATSASGILTVMRIWTWTGNDYTVWN